MKLKLIITGFDWNKFNDLKSKYWIKLGGITDCTKHKTSFVPDGPEDQENEPCWQCHDECVIYLTERTDEN